MRFDIYGGMLRRSENWLVKLSSSQPPTPVSMLLRVTQVSARVRPAPTLTQGCGGKAEAMGTNDLKEGRTFCPFWAPQHTPIYDISHTVHQKCCFWGEIRGKISQARTIQRKKRTFDTHNRGRWTLRCDMREKVFGSSIRRLNAIWPRVQVHVRNVQSLSQHSSAQEDQRQTHASARETRETHERQTRDRRETHERHPTFQAELEAETRGKCFPNETKSAFFFEKNPPKFFFQPPPEKIAVSRCFLAVAPLSLVACLSLSLVVSRCLPLSPLVPALQDESHHQEVAEGSFFF